MAQITTEVVTTARVTIVLDAEESEQFVKIQQTSDLLVPQNLDRIFSEEAGPSRYTRACRDGALELYGLFHKVITNAR